MAAAELEDNASGDWRPSLGTARAATATTVLGGCDGNGCAWGRNVFIWVGVRI
uniref:Uncharacterized protein n=1 Tax=Oryza sativa subsp. japonica TaxID=39947 RepID=Q6Z991_ORYSJ|nr:hypothetical protein [Oryza sativa Japonica Group]BAD03374.1 hypothetical protein [Oryza sativa Japonica Group]